MIKKTYIYRIIGSLLGAAAMAFMIYSDTELSGAHIAFQVFLITIGFGLGFGTIVFIQALNRLSKLKPKQFRDLMCANKANHYKGLFRSKGGYIYLLSDALRFEAHDVFQKKYAIEIPLEELVGLEFWWVMKGLPEQKPIGIKIYLKNDKKEQFRFDFDHKTFSQWKEVKDYVEAAHVVY